MVPTCCSHFLWPQSFTAVSPPSMQPRTPQPWIFLPKQYLGLKCANNMYQRKEEQRRQPQTKATSSRIYPPSKRYLFSMNRLHSSALLSDDPATGLLPRSFMHVLIDDKDLPKTTLLHKINNDSLALKVKTKWTWWVGIVHSAWLCKVFQINAPYTKNNSNNISTLRWTMHDIGFFQQAC